ncbi:MAG: LptF/LptG family permease [Candidatus Omnitrophica bacterium]|nr:LptF/LptG family permease [Candidatus Omnitrophota bacterium]
MKIIRNYLVKEMAGPFLVSLFISTTILTASNVIQMADLIINKGVNIFEMGKLLAYLMPSLLMFTVPISALSSVLLGFARLTSDNEVVALRASGISIPNMALPILTVGLILSLVSVPFNYIVVPESGYQARKLVKEIGVKNPTALLEPGVFLKIFKDYVIFIYDITGTQLKNVRIYQPQKNGPTRTMIAETGEIVSQPNENTIKIKLTNGMADETRPDEPNNFYKLLFNNYYITLNLKDSLRAQKIEKKAREYTIGELRSELKKYKEQRVDVTPLEIEIHNKIALAFSTVIFILIAIPIGLKTHRREKSINFGLALFIFMIYWGIMLGGIACAIQKWVPPWLGVWSPNILFGIVSLVLFGRVIKR